MAFQGMGPSNEVIEQALGRKVKMLPEIAVRDAYLKVNRHEHCWRYVNHLLSMSCLFKRKPVADDIFEPPPRISNPSSPNLDLSSSYLVARSCNLRKTRP